MQHLFDNFSTLMKPIFHNSMSKDGDVGSHLSIDQHIFFDRN